MPYSHISCAYPVLVLLLELLLEPVDLFLQNVDPLRELGRRQLLFLVVAGAERRAAPAAAESRGVNFARTRRRGRNGGKRPT